MSQFEYSLDQIASVAQSLVEQLPSKAVVLLDAEMGTGKTTLISQILKQWGIHEVSSPTYSICNVYRTSSGQTVHHYDLYRIKNVEELLEIGFQDLLETADYHFIEWPALGEPFYESPITWQISRNNDIRILTIL
jgi:tRNA threonylcarbamoyladenosine biosynthesis protein TsaE